MRIIAGKHKSRKLQTLSGLDTRPMMDRMKESIFNIIGPYLDGGIVLDLFGGSGALSLESLSRGASKAYINEKSPKAISVIKANTKLLAEEENITIINNDYLNTLKYLKEKQIKFDYVFLDPPFKMVVISDIIDFLLSNELLNNNAYVICQFLRGNHEPKALEKLDLIKYYNYATNEVAIYNFKWIEVSNRLKFRIDNKR